MFRIGGRVFAFSTHAAMQLDSLFAAALLVAFGARVLTLAWVQSTVDTLKGAEA